MIPAVAIAPAEEVRTHVAEAIRVLNSISGIYGANDVSSRLAALNSQQAWSERSLRTACAGLRSFRNLLLHEASTEYWLGQIAGPIRGVEDPGHVEMAADIASQRARQAAILTVALDELAGLFGGH